MHHAASVCTSYTFELCVTLYTHVLTVFMCIQMCMCVNSCAGMCGVSVHVCRLDGAHRVRRCCRALLTAAGNQSTLSVYSPTRRFLNDLP